MRVLEWAQDYKRITHDNMPQGTTCKDFFSAEASTKLPVPWPAPSLGGGSSSSGWHRPQCCCRLAYSSPLNSTNRQRHWQGIMASVGRNPHPCISMLYWHLGRSPSRHSWTNRLSYSIFQFFFVFFVHLYLLNNNSLIYICFNVLSEV